MLESILEEGKHFTSMKQQVECEISQVQNRTMTGHDVNSILIHVETNQGVNWLLIPYSSNIYNSMTGHDVGSIVFTISVSNMILKYKRTTIVKP